jgi:hypothetical protein
MREFLKLWDFEIPADLELGALCDGVISIDVYHRKSEALVGVVDLYADSDAHYACSVRRTGDHVGQFNPEAQKERDVLFEILRDAAA